MKKNYNDKPIKVFISYIAGQKKLFAIDMVCAVLVSVIDLVFPYVSRQSMKTLLPQNLYRTFFIIMLIMALAYVLKGVLYYVITVIGHRMGVLVEADMRKDVFSHMQALSCSFYDKNRTGALMSHITSDLFEVTELAHHGPENILICALTILGALAVMFTMEWRLALVLAVCLLLLMFCSRVSLKKIGVILLPACIAAFGLFVTGLYYARGGSTQTMDLSSLSAMPYSVRAAMSQNLYTALQLATRLLAYAGLGILFALSTEGDFFIASLLHQCHLPPKFAYGILAAFHLMPGMAREYAQVRTAFAARGLKAGPLSMKPVFTMLVNSVRWSESIAMAMESKGFCGDAPRTYYTVPRVHWYDLAAAALMVGGVVLGMLFLKY